MLWSARHTTAKSLKGLLTEFERPEVAIGFGGHQDKLVDSLSGPASRGSLKFC